MPKANIRIVKSSGEKAIFSKERLKRSLIKAGASEEQAVKIMDVIAKEITEETSTRQIHNKALKLLKKEHSGLAARYNLKRAIYELGPSGFPFEQFIAAILDSAGYRTELRKTLQGRCVSHEIDVLASKDNVSHLVECKFHSEEGRICDVKIPLYIHSRFRDVKQKWKDSNPLVNAWVVTNTRFSKDAVDYGKCSGLHLLSWDYPNGNGLKDQIDDFGLHPLTCSTLLTRSEKQTLLNEKLVLSRDLVLNEGMLRKIGVNEARRQRIINEMKYLSGL